MTETLQRLEQVERVVRHALEELQAVEPVVLDVQDKTPITDLMVVASGNSPRHVKSIADSVIENARKAGLRPVGIEGEDAGEWILVDLGDVVVHVMLPEVRELYRLERIWGLDSNEGGTPRLNQAHR